MRKVGEYLLANNRNAAIAAFICTLLPLIKLPGGFLAAVIVGLVTLQKGYKSGLWILTWVALPAVSLLFLGRFGVFDILLLRCVLIWFFAVLLREYRSWRLLLEVSVLLGFLVVTGFHLFHPDLKTWWTGHISNYFKDIGAASAWKLSADELKKLIDHLVPMATGIVGFVVLAGTFLQLVLARWWQSVLFNPGGLRREFNNIRIGRTLSLIAIVVLIGILFRIEFLIDFLPILLFPFVIAGLSLLHRLVEYKKGLLLPLVLVYIGMLFLTIFVVIGLALIGFFDSWYDFRKRV